MMQRNDSKLSVEIGALRSIYEIIIKLL